MQSSSQITTNKPTSNFLQVGFPSCHPTNSVKALKGNTLKKINSCNNDANAINPTPKNIQVYILKKIKLNILWCVVNNVCTVVKTGSRRSDHITAVLRRLHWLPVRRCNEFKLALLIYKSLNGSTPRYLSDDCQLVSDVGRRRLRSSEVSTCVVPRTHTGFGDRAFQVARPRLWNSLPASLRQSDTTVGQFKKLLKTHLFS